MTGELNQVQMPGLHVVQNHYRDGERLAPGAEPLPAYAASGAFALFGPPTIAAPAFPEERREDEPVINLGLIGGEIAASVAEGRRAGRPGLILHGTCDVVPG